MRKKTAFFLFSLSLFAFVFSPVLHANNLTISNVRMGTRDPASKTVSILFDVSWENSWRNKISHDAAWLTVRIHDIESSVIDRRLCKMKAAGLNPSGIAVGTASGLEAYVPQDKAGAFVRHAQSSEPATVSGKNVQLTVDYASCGFTEASQIGVTVNGLEMVFVPEGSFYAGDFAVSAGALKQGSADDQPWSITGTSSINVTGTVSGGYYYVSAGNPNEAATGASFTIPAAFPKGFSAFYAMKYEITEGEWVEFLNSLPSAAARSRHDLTDNFHKNSDAVVSRNTISCSGSPLVCVTDRPSRPVSFLTWKDLTAFLDWAALRPMTELEFEKAARGPFVPVKGEYAWSLTDITAAETISGTQEVGEEVIADQGANACFGSVAFSGGDSANGPEYQSGPLRGGIFATSSSDRKTSGAGNFGAMELSGNLKEWTVSIGNTEGLAFTGEHGDGFLSTAGGFEGNANVNAWPGMGTDLQQGIVTVSGVGFRGGSWADASERLRISDRQEATNESSDASATYGGRGVRTYDGE